jgi:hypothetical protein
MSDQNEANKALANSDLTNRARELNAQSLTQAIYDDFHSFSGFRIGYIRDKIVTPFLATLQRERDEATTKSIKPNIEDLQQWIADWGIAQEFDLEDALALIDAYQKIYLPSANPSPPFAALKKALAKIPRFRIDERGDFKLSKRGKVAYFEDVKTVISQAIADIQVESKPLPTWEKFSERAGLHLEYACLSDSDYSDETRAEIEKWLTIITDDIRNQMIINGMVVP